ncbi:MAG: hypothetical protein KDA31_05520 [Phycisphaerales bacterium]|nr:hypothetical protein [Phycisphaerales bacterium]
MRISKSAAVIASLVLSAGTASAQATWNNSFGGIWSDNMNWDTGSAPLVAGDSAIFPNLGMAYEVICNVNPTIDSVTINGPTQQLTIGDGKMLHIATGAGIINEGLLRINQTASVFDTRLFYDADLGGTVLAGSGTVELNGAGDPPDARIVVSTGTTLDISQPVSGTGMIEVQGTGLVNMSAPITANVSGQDLRITGSMNLVGGGTLEGISGGIVAVNGKIAGGNILGGVEFGSSSANLDGVTLAGDNGIRDSQTCRIGSNGIVNNGFFTINTAGSVFDTILLSDAPCSIAGTGTFDLNGAGDANDARLMTSTGNPMTIGSGITVTGNGVIRADLAPITMQGAVIADRAGEDLNLEGTFDFMGTGSIGSAGGIAFLLGADVTGASLIGDVDVGTASTLTDCDNTGTLRMRAGASITLENTLTNDGTITLNPEGSVFDSTIHVNGADAVIDGTGTITFNATTQPVDAAFRVGTLNTLTIGAGQTLLGSGKIGSLGMTTIQGAVIATSPTVTLKLENNFDMTGATAQGTTGVVEISIADLTGGTMLGGVEFSSSSVARGFTNTADLGIRDSGTLDLDGDITNNGTITINTAGSVFDARINAMTHVTVGGTGTIFLNGAGTPADAQLGATESTGFLTLPATQTIIGNGRIDGPASIAGTLSPGVDDATEGVIGLQSDIALAPTTTTQIDVFAIDVYDKFTLNANLALDGTISLKLRSGYVPFVGDSFTIIDAGTVTGDFATIDTPIIGGRLFRVIVNSGDIRALWTCIGDVNLDGTLSPADFSAWVAAFNAGDTQLGDQNLDGMVSPADFSAWVANFNSGC